MKDPNHFFNATCCDRCHGDLGGVRTMSYFNTDVLCSSCDKQERAHPMFAEAQRVERQAILDGDTNFPGIGLPADLIGGGHGG